MNDVYKDALAHWGVNAQRWAIIEEMGEVAQALSHERRGRIKKDGVINELIDLQTTINMLKPYYISSLDWNKRLRKAEIEIREKIKQKKA